MKEKKQSPRKLPGKVIAAVTFNDLASNCMWMLINYYLLLHRCPFDSGICRYGDFHHRQNLGCYQ